MIKKVIEVKKLTKRYKKLVAINDISFYVEKGEIFGLLGENGAGKTTTLEIIEGLRRATSGKIKILDCDVSRGCSNKIKERIGVQLQSSAYYDFLTLSEILKLFGSFYPKYHDPKELLDMVDLADKERCYVRNLSGGQKQRFSIIASLINDPEIVFLDEPTTGLDPIARRNLWEVISKIKAQGKTIILTTHYLEEAEMLCDRVAIMEKGKILVMGETHQLIEKAKNPYVINFILAGVEKKNLESINKLGQLQNLLGKSNHFEARFKTQAKLNEALKLIQKLKLESLTVGRATLEDLFIEITGKTIEDEDV